MKLIIAQGNPGATYTNTRHNVGFLLLTAYATQQGLTFTPKPKFLADIAEYTVNGEKVLLIKPTTFYNETGRCARAIADFYKVPITNILAIHDDLALPFGTLRTREKGSDAGNNGIKSLNAHLGQGYMRLRVGIHSEQAEVMGQADFVLAQFTAAQQEQLNSTISPKVTQLIDNFVQGNHTSTSHKL